jgi:hypothetical protein
VRRSSLLALVLVVVPAAAAQPEASPSLATLLTRHLPVLVLHPAEQLGPVAVDGFIADADLQQRSGTGWVKVDGPLPAGGADLRLDQRACRTIDGPAATPCYAASEAAHGSTPVAYGAVFRTKTRIALQYWLWYPFNPYSPTVPPGEVWQAHEGDWESVSVILDRKGKPLLVGLSQHSEGQRREWSRAPKRGLRPLAYVALGSHANYFTAGRHRFDPRIVEPIFIELIRGAGGDPVDNTGAGRVVRPKLVRITTTSPSWMTFAGRWGEDQYLHAPGNPPQMFGGGPTGPAFKEQWRLPVADVAGWPRG